MAKKERKLNGKGKAIAATGVFLAVAFVGGLRFFGAGLGIPASWGGVVSFSGFMLFFMGGFAIANTVGSVPAEDDS